MKAFVICEFCRLTAGRDGDAGRVPSGQVKPVMLLSTPGLVLVGEILIEEDQSDNRLAVDQGLSEQSLARL